MATINVSTFLRLKNAIEDSTSIEIIITDDTTTFLSQKPLQIYIGNPAETQKVTKITWEQNEMSFALCRSGQKLPCG